MKLLTAVFSILFFCFTTELGAQNAPVVTLGTVSTSASTVVVSVTVTNFTNIKAFDLKILYNQAIANPTGVTKGTGLGGSANYNLSKPGKIVIGWYAGSGVTMSDGSAIFNISFDKLSNRVLNLEFDFTDDYDCQFYNGSNQKLNDTPSGSFFIQGALTFTGESPVTTAPILTAAINDKIDIPITVSGFNNIGAVSLTLNYDSAVLGFNSGTNTGNYPGLVFGNTVPGAVIIGGFSSDTSGYTLANESVLFTLNFTYKGGSSVLSWNDNGESCEYTGPLSEVVLSDTPQSTYYINGSVGSVQVALAPEIEVEEFINPVFCNGSGTIPLTFTNVPDGTYTINFFGGSFPNIDVLASAAVISAPAGIYNDVQITVNGETSVSGVNVVLTDPASPVQPVITAGGPTSFCEGGNVVLTSVEALTYQWSTGETTQNITVSASGNYSVTVSNASGCSATSEVTIVTVNAKPEKPALVNCWDEFIYNTNTCTWENAGVKPAKPAMVNCWDDFQFSETLCAWENKGAEPLKPEVVNCWDEFVFNTNTCMWENSGVQPVEPVKVNCWDDFHFNETLCVWENNSTEPLKPEIVNCWDEFVFNSNNCVWNNIGTKPTKPTQVNCWDDLSFNTNSCEWENIGVELEKPAIVNCWDDFQFNEISCAWENKGTKPVEPTPLKSWDEFIFNSVSCAWENIGVATGLDIYRNVIEMALTSYPNPFTEKTTIQYVLPENGRVNMEVSGILGNRITLLSNQFQPAGEYLLDLDGEQLAAGIYQITLRLTGVNGGDLTGTFRIIKQ